jgi:cell wall-associated NlpC family hydrolase
MSNLSTSLDPRVNAYRPDLADLTLRNDITAARYVEPVIRQCVRGLLPLLEAPKHDAKQVSQIRYGEFLDVFETREDGFAWVQNRSDRYVGYIPSDDALSEEIASLSYRIGVLQTFVYAKPDIKTPPIDELTFGSFVRLDQAENNFKKLASGGYVFDKHVFAAPEVETKDYVFTAGKLLNVPYLWGGRTPKGIDCSGLVQLALWLAGIEAPRDSDQQREAFGQPLTDHWRDRAWKRGDLVFFPGHVGIMTNISDMIHASAFDMKVVVEPLYDVVMRGNEVLAAGRPTD